MWSSLERRFSIFLAKKLPQNNVEKFFHYYKIIQKTSIFDQHFSWRFYICLIKIINAIFMERKYVYFHLYCRGLSLFFKIMVFYLWLRLLMLRYIYLIHNIYSWFYLLIFTVNRNDFTINRNRFTYFFKFL